jgi:hypothetical protein
MGTPYQSRHSAWFHFSVTGLPMGCVLRIQVANASSNSGLYKYDMVSYLMITDNKLLKIMYYNSDLFINAMQPIIDGFESKVL